MPIFVFVICGRGLFGQLWRTTRSVHTGFVFIILYSKIAQNGFKIDYLSSNNVEFFKRFLHCWIFVVSSISFPLPFSPTLLLRQNPQRAGQSGHITALQKTARYVPRMCNTRKIINLLLKDILVLITQMFFALSAECLIFNCYTVSLT